MTTNAIIEKWYKTLSFPKEYDAEFYRALNEIEISPDTTIDTYDIDCPDGKRNLLSCLYMCEAQAEKCRKKGIDEDIIIDTLRDFVTWTNTWTKLKGELYLGELIWLNRHIDMKLFRLGRLQFCMSTAEHDIHEKGISEGDKVIEIHIPEGDALTKEACVESIERAKIFLKKHFPEFSYNCFLTHTWLLDDTLTQFLKPESNILKFQTLFDKVYKNESSAILRYTIGWDTMPENLTEKTPSNSFGQKIKEYFLSGGKFYEVLGILK